MPQIAGDMLLYLVIIVAFLALNHLFQRAAQRARQARHEDAEMQPPAPGSVAPLEDYAWGHGAGPAPFAAVPTQVAITRAQQSTAARASRPSDSHARTIEQLRHSEGVRQALVLMTILGPCRALQPYDSDGERR